MDPLEVVGFSPWRDRAGEDGKPSVILEALNITSLATAFDNLAERGSAMFITKHATPVKYHGACKRRARNAPEAGDTKKRTEDARDRRRQTARAKKRQDRTSTFATAS